ncbi:DUF5803 family protein [Halococcus sp. IIIV-5B]|uniref:DUF5803 family protein n=1 Tax=Halococcus sp. IIIV-5B TaxID=2321230 RepID=UPI000E71A9CB|nr:DUF5803 family protein [Halococcus sp. IIIV-5B]RJT06869.1 hypothetical protein D3261_05000 [Halococcus sp. IIIV-5B]
MNRTRALGFVLFLAFVALAGCTSAFGPSPANQDALTQNESYDWNTDVNASINITGGSYEAVYRVDNRSEFVVQRRDSLQRDRPLAISALKFQYPNGSVVTAASPKLNATNEQERTVIDLPARDGRVAFESSAQGKQFVTETFVPGSYEVTIPKGMRVDYEPLARVDPGDYETERTASGHVRIHWENVESDSVAVRYYLERDLYIFAGGLAILVVVALVGVLYYLRQIRGLEAERRKASPDGNRRDDP